VTATRHFCARRVTAAPRFSGKSTDLASANGCAPETCADAQSGPADLRLDSAPREEHAMELERSVGLRADGTVAMLDRRTAIRAIALKLAALGHSVPDSVGDQEVLDLARDLFARYREQTRLLS